MAKEFSRRDGGGEGSGGRMNMERGSERRKGRESGIECHLRRQLGG